MSLDDLKKIIEEHGNAILEELPLQTIIEGTLIPDGFSQFYPGKLIADLETGEVPKRRRVSVRLQVSLPGNLVIRFRLRIPLDTSADPKTWTVSKLIYLSDKEEFKL